jgi:flavin reductase (DIM6/NTAB) family NADH-FMN oxidoreductase RutF
VDRDAISKGLALIPSGCSILTAASPAGRTGMLASWVQQASIDPPMVSVAVKRGRPIEALMSESQRFCLNILGEDPKPFFKQFGGGFRLDQDAFAGLAATDTPYGVELGAAIARLACSITSVVEAGDHNLYLGRIVGATTGAGRPYVHIRKSGLSY